MNQLPTPRLTMFIVLHLACAAVGQTGDGPFAAIADDPKLPRVLLIGDSISIGYTIPVRQMLARQANVHRVPTNGGPTTFGLLQLDQWLGAGKWDLIHFNFGLHDVKYVDDDGARVAPAKGHQQVSPVEYRENLRKLVRRLQATGAKLIWCTTTPIPEGAHGRNPGDAKIYNAIAADVIGGSGGVAVNDLYGFALPRLADIQRPADVHFSPEGSRQLALQVAATIRESLALPSPTPDVARGVVYVDRNANQLLDDGDRRLPGARVSNGEQIVVTDDHGRYELPVTDDTMLFVLKPRGYRPPLSEHNLPQFFYNHKPHGSPGTRFAGVAPTGALPSSVDFPLYDQDEPYAFKALMFGDPQPRTQEEVDFIAHDVVEEVLDTDASFGVTLGDIVFDDLTLFESQARMIALVGIPWYNVIGNHDINYDAKNDRLSDESFERAFGPAYYSFDHGPVHFLVLDDVEWYIEQNGEGKYRGGLGKQQMEFIRNDLASIADEQLVVLMMHIPLTDVHDRRELYRLIEKRPFCLSISAHTHRHEHRMIGQEDGWLGPEPHHHVINVTVSGSWWSGAKDERGVPHTIMADGAPNGYSILSFDGNQYKLDFRAAGRPRDYQMSIHAPETVDANKAGESFVYANVFNGSAKTKVEMRIGDGNWREMLKVWEEDPFYRQVYVAEQEVLTKFEQAGAKRPWMPLNGGRPSAHLWKLYLPDNVPAGTHLIHVRATDTDSRVYHGRRIIRIE